MQKRNYVKANVLILEMGKEDVLLKSGDGFADDNYNDGWEEEL